MFSHVPIVVLFFLYSGTHFVSGCIWQYFLTNHPHLVCHLVTTQRLPQYLVSGREANSRLARQLLFSLYSSITIPNYTILLTLLMICVSSGTVI